VSGVRFRDPLGGDGQPRTVRSNSNPVGDREQQRTHVGGSVGTALLSTLFASAASSYAASHAHLRGLASAAIIHGYTTAFWWAAGIFALGLLVALLILLAKARISAPTVKPALVTE
jgi:hypothetical protein